jgi:nitroimidazol reductase NimA-like FMN-containing flavoprotein (pyridoxamine 5'-phosphate oxidase superfamily)
MTMQETESFLREAKVARFCSFNRDGTIHAAPVWYKYENGEIIAATLPTRRKARNVRRTRTSQC